MSLPTDVSSFITARRRTWTFSRQRSVGTSLEAWQRQTDSFITKLSERVASSASSARTTTAHVISTSQESAHAVDDTSNQSAGDNAVLSQPDQTSSASPDSSSHEQSNSGLLTDKENGTGSSDSLGLCNNRISPFRSTPADPANSFEVVETLSASAFADVYKVQIRPDHLAGSNEYVGNEPSKFAVKRLFNSRSTETRREIDALERIVHFEDPAFMQPVARWNSSGDTYIMFPLADGNMRDLLHSDLPAEDPMLLSWTHRQMLGLAEGVQTLHAAHGRHSDLKPENILWFSREKNDPPQLNLKITDFGITRFSSSDDSKAIGSQLTFTPAYRAPEIDMIDGRASQALDVWALGCIFIEFLTWTMLGSGGVARLEEMLQGDGDLEAPSVQYLDSAFFQAIAAPNIHGSNQPFIFRIKSAVSQWISDLRQHPHASKAVQDLLDLVGNHLLVISPERRMTAAALVKALADIGETSRRHPAYWTEPAVQWRSFGLLLDSAAEVEELSDTEGATGEQPQPTPLIVRGSNGLIDLCGSYANAMWKSTILNAQNLRLLRPEEFDHKSRMGRLLGQLSGVLPRKYRDLALAPNRLHKPDSEDGWQLSWTYGYKQLCIHLSPAEADLLASHVPVQSQNSSYLPQWMAIGNQEEISTGTSGNSWSPAAFPKVLQQIWDRLRWRGAQSVENRGTEKPEDDGEEPQGWSETFLTTDRVWSTSKCKVLRRLSPDSLKDDEELFSQVGAALREVQGWSIGYFIPWKTYSCAELARFTVHFRNRDLVHVAPYSPADGDTPSNFGHGFLEHIQTSNTTDPAGPSSTSPAEVRVLMAYLGENLCHGLLDPTLGSGDRTVLDGIPKRWCPPPLKMEPKQSGLCFHIAQGLSPLRMIFWGVASLIVGLAFVPFWLCFVDSKDLQNAFVPVTWTISVYVAVLAIVTLEGAM